MYVHVQQPSIRWVRVRSNGGSLLLCLSIRRLPTALRPAPANCYRRSPSASHCTPSSCALPHVCAVRQLQRGVPSHLPCGRALRSIRLHLFGARFIVLGFQLQRGADPLPLIAISLRLPLEVLFRIYIVFASISQNRLTTGWEVGFVSRSRSRSR